MFIYRTLMSYSKFDHSIKINFTNLHIGKITFGSKITTKVFYALLNANQKMKSVIFHDASHFCYATFRNSWKSLKFAKVTNFICIWNYIKWNQINVVIWKMYKRLSEFTHSDKQLHPLLSLAAAKEFKIVNMFRGHESLVKVLFNGARFITYCLLVLGSWLFVF